MGNIVYMAYTVILAGLFIYLLRLPAATGRVRALLLLVAGALVYDNGVTALGFFIGEGSLLKGLNTFRFIFHVFVTPLICVIAFDCTRHLRVTLALRKAAGPAVWALTGALIAIGFYQDLAHLSLVPKTAFGALKYTHAVSAPPVAAIVVNIFAIAASVLIWRKTGWPGLFITSIGMLLLGSIPPRLVDSLAGNAGEIIFVCGFILALRRQPPPA